MKNKKQKPQADKPTTIDMPEVKDIPGQEHVKPPRMREMMDSTAASDGEEGKGLLDDLNKEEDELMDDSTNVNEQEKKLLKQAEQPFPAEETKAAMDAALDSTDGEDLLNEGGTPMDMGEDLDIPGSELDDEDEELGEEDEENNSYSSPKDQS